MEALLSSAWRRGSALVVGIDPDPGRLPPEVSGSATVEAIREFCLGILEAVEPEAAAVKLQSACFERLGPAGARVYADVLSAASDLDLPTIADVKRGDVGHVAAAYAEAHLRTFGATSVTVNPYMGSDAVVPFLEEARRLDRGGGAFILAATSNPSAEKIQAMGDPPLFERVCGLISLLGEKSSGSAYPDAGAVVGATRPEVGRRARELLPETLFLVPGYGAQGGGASEVLPLLDGRGGGVLVNSSRGVIYAWEDSRAGYREAAREAARRARGELEAAGVGV